MSRRPGTRRRWIPPGGIVDRKIVRPLLGIEDSPRAIARGVALGIWVAMTPTIGIQMLVVVAIASLLRWFRVKCNILAGCLLCWITNPVTALPIYWFNYTVGCFVLGEETLTYEIFRDAMPTEGNVVEVMRDLVQLGLVDLALPLWVGSLGVATGLAGCSYPLVVRGVVRSKERIARLIRTRQRRQALQILRSDRWRREGRAPSESSAVWWRRVPLVLASRSLVRREILEELRLDFVVQVPDDEGKPTDAVDPIERVRAAAIQKARSVAQPRRVGWIVAADTVLVESGEILERPTDEGSRLALLERLAGRVHEVVTGIAILDPATHEHVADVARTRICLTEIPEAIMAEWIVGRDGREAYPIPRHEGFPVEWVEGERSAALGLPRNLLLDLLERLRRQSEPKKE